MTSRRAPLAAVPNAINSPFHSASGKRTRAQAGDHKDVYGQPPTKKQIIEVADNEENVDPCKRRVVTISSLEKLEEPFGRRSNNAQPTAFERKLVSACEKKPTPQLQKPAQRTERTHKTQSENIDSVRQWQRHYRKQFPGFVFYFDSVPDDIRSKLMRQIHQLGAREEKFFSNNVTHVVTSRSIPPEHATTSPDEDVKLDSASAKGTQSSAPTQVQRRTTSLLDAHLQRRTQPTNASAVPNMESRKPQPHTVDVLSRARTLSIKIWALEKLHRVLGTILDTDAGDHGTANDTRSHASTARLASKPTPNADLEQLLRNEKITGSADRDMTVATQDMVTLRGVWIYVHDMDEKTRPVMARDYVKPEPKEEGKWPQFRVSGPGRCPFVDDPSHAKRIQQARDQEKIQQEVAQRKTRAGFAMQTAGPLAEREASLRRSPRKHAQPSRADGGRPLDPPKGVPIKRQSSELAPTFFGSAQASLRGLPRMVGGEPVASGMQHYNVTSAIRSQAISSAAISSTAPGLNRRLPDSKEVSMLKRKVWGPNQPNVPSNLSVPSSYMNDVRAAINDDQGPPPRAAKRKAQETLGVVHEDDGAGKRVPAGNAQSKRKKVEKKDAKPGYCENCRDKFDDFDEHVISRKHRKFALTLDHWGELDNLLSKLKRPHKIT